MPAITSIVVLDRTDDAEHDLLATAEFLVALVTSLNTREKDRRVEAT